MCLQHVKQTKFCAAGSIFVVLCHYFIFVWNDEVSASVTTSLQLRAAGPLPAGLMAGSAAATNAANEARVGEDSLQHHPDRRAVVPYFMDEAIIEEHCPSFGPPALLLADQEARASQPTCEANVVLTYRQQWLAHRVCACERGARGGRGGGIPAPCGTTKPRCTFNWVLVGPQCGRMCVPGSTAE